ncbi:MAG: 6,7-dimethyl-8-ribityllumazine synthase [Pyrinomonadaceae bacterium]
MKPITHQGKLKADGLRFAVVVSRWNELVTSKLVEGALDGLERLGVEESNVTLFKVPGSLEIPLLASKLADSEKYDAIICLGTVIRGQTPHFEYVASEVTKGIGQIGIETGIPVVYGIITADTLEQALDRAGGKSGNKGFEAALVAVELANLYRQLALP